MMSWANVPLIVHFSQYIKNLLIKWKAEPGGTCMTKQMLTQLNVNKNFLSGSVKFVLF